MMRIRRQIRTYEFQKSHASTERNSCFHIFSLYLYVLFFFSVGLLKLKFSIKNSFCSHQFNYPRVRCYITILICYVYIFRVMAKNNLEMVYIYVCS